MFHRKTHPLFLNNSSFLSEKCILLRANTSFYNPVQTDCHNSLSICVILWNLFEESASFAEKAGFPMEQLYGSCL